MSRQLGLLALVAAMLFAPCALAQSTQPATSRPVDPALIQFDDDPALPRVLVIGDSISMGYTPVVREMMKGKANLHHPPENCQWSAYGVEKLDRWLGDKKWDVITFNFGLHDLKFVDAKNNAVDVANGHQLASADEYEKNLSEIAKRLKATGAKIIFVNTTPVPANTGTRVEGSESKYNEAAARVMADEKIPTVDLHAMAIANPRLQLPANVHFTKQGYKTLGEQVKESIEEALKK